MNLKETPCIIRNKIKFQDEIKRCCVSVENPFKNLNQSCNLEQGEGVFKDCTLETAGNNFNAEITQQ